MKKFFAFMIMAAALAACTRVEQPRNETPEQPEVPATYTLTLQASKGTDTRGLVLNDNTLNAIWDGSEQVYVYLNGNLSQEIAILTPVQSGQANCVLRGDFAQPPVAGNVLTLKLNRDNYMDQRGTLAYIGANCDYAIATVTVTGVNDGKIASQEGGAKFENQQAIVKFSLKNDAGTAAIKPTSLTVQVDGTSVATVNQINAGTYNTNGADGVLFVAIPPIDNKTIDLSATVGENPYTYKRTGVSFTAGQYYSITVKMTKKTSTSIDLSDERLYVNGLFTAQDGDVLTGIFPDDGWSRRIRIDEGATVTLRNATIANSCNRFPGIGLDGSATIILEGINTVSANSIQPGILVGDSGTTLTITGEGVLKATGDYLGAAIGSRGSSSATDVISCGNIVILSGTIIATSNRAAGIGSGSAAYGGTVSCGDITISAPAHVTATRGEDAPYSIGPSISGLCGTVTIYGTTYVPEPGGILSRNPLNIPITSGN